MKAESLHHITSDCATGPSSSADEQGIGQSITIALAGEGATVTMVARRVGSLHLVAAKRGELESRAIRYPVDILEKGDSRPGKTGSVTSADSPTCLQHFGRGFCGPKTAAMSLARERPPT